MKTILFFISIFVFSIIWQIIITKYLPDAATGNKQDHSGYSEKQRSIILETLARTCIWLVYFLIITMLTRYLGQTQSTFDLMSEYPSLITFIALIILGCMNYWFVKKKYSTTD
ncbi:hypothetical protein [Staphylococcus edaphicus]|uniref:Uncharacterized protein n=1 Tax=Staphylococcus edaphicus TaxID=1955013 RepID=A0A2C6WKZ0_9STAP|nr:hypothetical protein [Staphylococcus edaphicus]PHK49039.1 hypothetical protein BTJ66_10470 [Staphylococcus edaphicus]UQW81364.1 hypothetical protein MNY58_12515 [Staphylococcus edaphicus]